MALRKKIGIIKSHIDEINILTKNLLGNGHIYFRDHHLELEVKKNYEQTFVRSISWFYSLYHELAGENLNFFKPKIKDDPKIESVRHLEVIHAMRTYFQHALMQPSKRSRSLKNIVEDYFLGITGEKYPVSESQWKAACIKLFEDVRLFLKAIKNAIEVISKDKEFRKIIIKNWKNHLNDRLSIEEVKKVFREVSKNIGLDYYDIQEICNSNYDSWMSKLNIFYSDSKENRLNSLQKIIEKELISYEHLPIDGNDIMERFDIDPGPEVKDKLLVAKELFANNPCSKEELLEKLVS